MPATQGTHVAKIGERFDLVLFLGVFYHLRHPLLALDILHEITARQMVLQTLTMPGYQRGSAACIATDPVHSVPTP